jgi:hypothetical protein
MLRLKIAILTLVFAAAECRADTTTAPSSQDLPAPAAMAPTYVAIGKELLIRVAILRQTLGDLTLAPQVRKSASQILDDAEKNLKQLLHEVQAGNMPTYGTIMAVPQNMRAAHQKLLAAIGPDQSQLLDEKLRSLRGEARSDLAKAAEVLDDKKLTDEQMNCCNKILADAQAEIDKLPDTDVEGDQYTADRQSMDQLMARVRDDLAKVVAPVEQSKAGPSTQPTPRS